MTHGGKRPNAGRKPPPGESKATSRTLRLYPSTWALLEGLCGLTGKNQREVLEMALELCAEKVASRDL